jgi:hypothetical protein
LHSPPTPPPTSDDVLQATNGDNVTGACDLDVLTVVGVHEHEAADALLLVLVGVQGVAASLKDACVQGWVVV